MQMERILTHQPQIILAVISLHTGYVIAMQLLIVQQQQLRLQLTQPVHRIKRLLPLPVHPIR